MKAREAEYILAFLVEHAARITGDSEWWKTGDSNEVYWQAVIRDCETTLKDGDAWDRAGDTEAQLPEPVRRLRKCVGMLRRELGIHMMRSQQKATNMATAKERNMGARWDADRLT